MKIERPRGTRDFLPEEMEKRRDVEKRLREIAESFGYREVATPTFEHSELFKLKSGEGIIEEMYVFKDKSERELALRPELTAPIIRMFVNECSRMPKPLRFYYIGNCFRYERPQKARYREFWQFGVELIGSDSYLANAEVIFLAYKMLKSLEIDFELNIGHVGILRSILSPLGDKAERAMRLIDKNDKDALKSYFDEL
ncbi:MAG: ATP phosphoribosyltransferase regulatory subunit, partial [Archaeoglobaceae archaeon]